MNSIELNIDYVDLLAEKDSVMFKIELWKLDKSREFKIPEEEKEFKIDFEFIHERMESFEIVGQLKRLIKIKELTTLNFSHVQAIALNVSIVIMRFISKN